MVGIPLFERHKGPNVGTWLRDPLNPDKIWVTKGWYGTTIYEHSSMKTFVSDQPDRTHSLGLNQYQGTNHAMFNGSVYYQRAGHHVVVRYDLKRTDVVSFQNMHGSNYNNSRYLYATGKSYYDISIDENGLWVIYAKVNFNSILSVSKLDLYTMQVLKTWEIQVDHRSYGNGFIICGVLYLVRSVNTQRTHIDYAYDLYTDKVRQEKISFINPYAGNVQLTYVARDDPRKCLIYGWDSGYQISYQLLF